MSHPGIGLSYSLMPSSSCRTLSSYLAMVWFGLVAPAGTPDAVIDKLNAAFVRAVRDPDVVKQMTAQGAEPVVTTPAEFAAFIASETERFGTVVRAVGARAE